MPELYTLYRLWNTSCQDGGRSAWPDWERSQFDTEYNRKKLKYKERGGAVNFRNLSTHRNLLVKLRASRDSKNTEISKLEMQITKIKAELETCSGKYVKEHGTPSLIHGPEPADTMAKEHGTPSPLHCQEPGGMTARGVALTGSRGGKLYSEGMGGEKNLKTF